MDKTLSIEEIRHLVEDATTNGHNPTPTDKTTGGKPKLSEWEQKKQAAHKLNDPLLTHDALWDLLATRTKEIIESPRRITQQKQAIKAVAKDLGFNLSNQEVNDLYNLLDNTLTSYEPPVEPGGEFLTFSQSWLLEGLILIGLNLLVGMPGASKSRLLVALVRAFLHGQETFINRELLNGTGRHVLIIGTDQDRQQWGALLAEAGLATVISTEKVDGRTQVLYRLHERITLHTSGGGFKLDADGMRYILEWNRKHPGGLCIIDSLSAVLPQGVSENDETAGRLIRHVELVRQGNCCIVTHHSNKQSAMSGELGVYSGSGHGSIDRAVSRFIGLGFESHLEYGKEKLHQESPRRIITSQKRGGGNERIVVENGDHNTWDYISTAAEDRELKRQAEEGDPEETLKGWKRAVYDCTTDDWLTTSQVFDRLSPARARQATAKQQVRRTLRDLITDHDLLESRDSEEFQGEMSWRRKPASYT